MPNTDKVRTRSHSDMQAIEEKLDLILSDISKIKQDNVSIKEDINLVRSEIKQFKDDMSKSLDNCFDFINEVKETVNKTNLDVKLHEECIDALKNENIHLKKEVLVLNRRLSSAEQYSRSNCLDIQGVPEAPSENIFNIVTNVGKAIGFTLEPQMVDAVHRLAPNPNKPNAPRGIIIKFCRRVDMEEMRRKAIRKGGFSASNLGLSNEHTVYVNLSMTRETRILWSETRKFKAVHRYRFAWITSSGKIFLRKSEKDPAVLIDDLSDLQRLKPPRKNETAAQSSH